MRENKKGFDYFINNQQGFDSKETVTEKKDKIMTSPEIVVEPEKGIHLMSLMLKGYDFEWGNNKHELAMLAKEYFKKYPLNDKIKKKLDEIEILDENGIDQETLFNISLIYQHPERSYEILTKLEKDKGIENLGELQQNILELMERFEKELNQNPEFSILENRFDKETQKDIEARKGRLDSSKEEIDKLIGFFRPRAETTRAKR